MGPLVKGGDTIKALITMVWSIPSGSLLFIHILLFKHPIHQLPPLQHHMVTIVHLDSHTGCTHIMQSVHKQPQTYKVHYHIHAQMHTCMHTNLMICCPHTKTALQIWRWVQEYSVCGHQDCLNIFQHLSLGSLRPKCV